jgi:glutamine synthetase
MDHFARHLGQGRSRRLFPESLTMNQPAELAAYLERHPETRFLDAVLYDLCGTAIGKRVPIRDAAKLWSGGVAFCAGITTLDALGACWDVNGIGFSDGDPDATSYPLPGTLVPVPWAEVPTAQVQIAPAPPEDAPHWWFDPRAILGAVVARFADLGLKPVVANELEFYVVDPNRDDKGRISPALPARSGRAPEAPRVLAFDKLDEWAGLLAEIDAACIAQGVPAGAATAEYGGAQFEVNLGHLDDPVLACDHALMLRRIVKGVAAKHGLEACMSMPAWSMTRAATCSTRPPRTATGSWAMPSRVCRPQPMTRWDFSRPTSTPIAALPPTSSCR